MSTIVDSSPNAFVVFDCSLALRATGQSVSNLRGLHYAVQQMDSFSLEHHMMRCHLGDRFELNEFPNDLARWCWEELDDHITGERLALVDPYAHASYDSLRAEIGEIIEERLWWNDQPVPACRPGMEFHLVGSQLVAYETAMRLESPAALAEHLPRMSRRSLYFHVHDARRRSHGLTDDFSAWLESVGTEPELVRAIRQIDFYFLNLSQLRDALQNVFQEHFPAYQTPVGASTS